MEYTVNCSILLTDLPLMRRPFAAREAGYRAVEYWWPFTTPNPPAAAIETFINAIQEAGVQLTGLNFAAGDMAAGDRGLLSNPHSVGAFRDSVDIAVAIGQQLGTRAFNALYGNRMPNIEPAAQDDVAAENLAYAARAADRIGATILIEPCSGAPDYPLKSAADVLGILDRLEEQHGIVNARLLADLYHLHVNGDDIDAVIENHCRRIGHVQIADAPGRGEPGSGQIPLDRHLRNLAAGGYTGWVGLEYKSSRNDAVVWQRIPADEPRRTAAPTTEMGRQ